MPEGLFAIIGSPSPTFAGDLAIELRSLGLLDGIERKTIGAAPSLLSVNLTLTGWERYEHRGQSTWESIKDAVRDAWHRVTGQKDVDVDKMAESGRRARNL